jgi:serine/threonine protein kinase
MSSNILYDEKNDDLYILIYKLGKGGCAIVWFAIQLQKFIQTSKQKKLNIFYKALKIHNKEDYDEGILETKIIELLPKNEPESKYINYPETYFINNKTVIVVYNTAIGSLYDILKMYNKKLPKEFIYKIIPQMVKSIEFIHKNGYVHTDIKPENYLLVGMTNLQNKIIDFVKKYNLFQKFNFTKKKKIITKNNMMNIIKIPIYTMLNELTNIFNFIDNENTNSENTNSENTDSENTNSENENSDNENSDNENSDNENSDNENSDNDNENSSKEDESEYLSDSRTETTYTSKRGEYEEIYDHFHRHEIEKYNTEIEEENESEESENESESEERKKEKEEEREYIKKYIEEPNILLMDFGLMRKEDNLRRTVQTRYYRSPEIIFGLKYNRKIDLWALGCSIYELLAGEILIDVEKTEYIKKYDRDLIQTKLLIERIEKEGYKEIKELIKKSPRQNCILNADETTKYFKELEYDNWKNHPIIKETDSNIVIFIEKLLQINPINREFTSL